MATVQIHGTLLGNLGARDRIVTATLVDLNGTPQLGYVADVEGEIVTEISTSAGPNGSWSMELYGNADVASDFGDTLYRITEGPGFNRFGSNTYYVGVPTSGGPYWAVDLKVTPPGGAAPETFAVVSVDGFTGAVDLSGRYLQLGGGTLTGALTLSGDPVSDLQAATKQYVDNNAGGGGPSGGPYLPLSGGTLSGALTLSGDPSEALEAATKQYVDAVATDLDNETVRATAAESTLTTSVNGKVSKSGDTMTGALTLSGDPTEDLHAATKAYVDDAVSNGGGGATGDYLPLSGGTLTGALTLSGAPTNSLHAATKAYVDNETVRATAAEALLAPKASPTFTGTVSGITKSMVGLGNVDNTSDASKPVSTATQTALNLKADLDNPTFTGIVESEYFYATGNVTIDGNLTVVTGVGSEVTLMKFSDESVASSASLQNDDDMVYTVEANAWYLVEVVAVWTTGGGGFRCNWSVPSGSDMAWTDNDGAGRSAIGADITFSSTTGTTFKGLLRVGGTSGSVRFRWAQNSSNAAATVLKAGSYMYLRRVL